MEFFLFCIVMPLIINYYFFSDKCPNCRQRNTMRIASAMEDNDATEMLVRCSQCDYIEIRPLKPVKGKFTRRAMDKIEAVIDKFDKAEKAIFGRNVVLLLDNQGVVSMDDINKEYDMRAKRKGIFGGLINEAQNMLKDMLPNRDNTAMLKEIWDKQTIQEILNGEITIPEETINSQLKKRNDVNQCKDTSITLKQDGTIEIRTHIDKLGTVLLLGEIVDAVHNKQESYCRYVVHNKMVANKPFVSWCLSLLTISILSRLFGRMEIGEGITANVNGNEIVIDFKEWLEKSKAGRIQLGPVRLLDAVEVQNIKVQERALKIKVKPNLDPAIMATLRMFA